MAVFDDESIASIINKKLKEPTIERLPNENAKTFGERFEKHENTEFFKEWRKANARVNRIITTTCTEGPLIIIQKQTTALAK